MMEPEAITATIQAKYNLMERLELYRRLNAPQTRNAITVTDLLNPKLAYFVRKRPDIPVPLDQQERMMEGTGFHKLFGRAVAPDHFLEQSIAWNGVRGRIDLINEFPVEIKSTASLSDGDIHNLRPKYFEQIGMYCSMTDISRGQVIVYVGNWKRNPDITGDLRVWNVEFTDLDAVREEMVRRRDLLIQALETENPAILPTGECARFQCRFNEANVCDCHDSPWLMPNIAEMATVVDNPSEAHRYLVALRDYCQRSPPAEFSFWDLIFPREAFLTRQAEIDEEEDDDGIEDLDAQARKSMKMGIRDGLKHGARGEFVTKSIENGALRGYVTYQRDVPWAFKLCYWNNVAAANNSLAVAKAFGLHLQVLGMQCAALGEKKARIAVWYPKLEEDRRLVVYDIEFVNLGPYQRMMEERLAQLEKAKSVTDLPLCPSWKFKSCRHRQRCGCEGAKVSSIE